MQFPYARHDDQVDAMTQFLDWLEKQDDIDFSKANFSQEGIIAIARGSDYYPSLSSLRPKGEKSKGEASSLLPSHCYIIRRLHT